MKNKTKEQLIVEWKLLRGAYFNIFNEDFEKFEKKHRSDPLFDSVVKSFDKSFKEVNQVAVQEIEEFLNTKG